MNSGSAGMGMSKHRKSGRVPANKTVAMQRAREANAEAKRRAKLKAARKGRTAESIAELMGGKP